MGKGQVKDHVYKGPVDKDNKREKNQIGQGRREQCGEMGTTVIKQQ